MIFFFHRPIYQRPQTSDLSWFTPSFIIRYPNTPIFPQTDPATFTTGLDAADLIVITVASGRLNENRHHFTRTMAKSRSYVIRTTISMSVWSDTRVRRRFEKLIQTLYRRTPTILVSLNTRKERNEMKLSYRTLSFLTRKSLF